MDPDAVKSTHQNLAFGNVMAAAARRGESPRHQLRRPGGSRAGKIARGSNRSVKEARAWRVREITEGDFLGEVTGSEKTICHFYHREFYRCKIMDKHLKTLASKHVDTKFIKLDAENAPFFVTKLGVKTLPCVISTASGMHKGGDWRTFWSSGRLDRRWEGLDIRPSRSDLLVGKGFAGLMLDTLISFHFVVALRMKRRLVAVDGRQRVWTVTGLSCRFGNRVARGRWRG
ncbi:hypothetical protein ACLB2K_053314 [Fragaria x ananassa]